MFSKLALVLVSALFCSNVFAGQVYQTLAPDAGQSEVTPSLGLGYGTATSKFAPNNTTDISLFNAGVNYYYGLTTGHALGLELNYGTQEVKSNAGKTKYKGLSNPTVKYKGLFELGAMTAFAQAGYSFAIEKDTFNSGDGEGNLARGQNGILINVGLYAPVSQVLIVGGYINYDKRLDGETTSTNNGGVDSVDKHTGGGSLLVAGFVEFQNDWHPNISLGFIDTNTSTIEDPSGVKSDSEGVDMAVVSGSARFQIQPNFSINPEVTLMSARESDIVKNYNVIIATVSGRWLF